MDSGTFRAWIRNKIRRRGKASLGGSSAPSRKSKVPRRGLGQICRMRQQPSNLPYFVLGQNRFANTWPSEMSVKIRTGAGPGLHTESARFPAAEMQLRTARKERNRHMEITKYHAEEVVYLIRHNMRDLPNGKQSGNDAIDPALTSHNYSLIDRGKNAEEINQYRLNLEKEIYRYKRPTLVHAVEVVIQCPADCPVEQKKAFFEETYRYFGSRLPMGERCIFLAQVHVDEKHRGPDGSIISKDHLHLMYVPAIPDTKHPGYEYKMCADQLTKKADLKRMHRDLQAHLDSAGIQASVVKKKEGSGKNVSLSVAQLKELTRQTGIVLDHSLTMEELASLIVENNLKQGQIQVLQDTLEKKSQELERLKTYIEELKNEHQIVESSWGNSSGWGTSSWGEKAKSEEIEK